MKLAVYYNLNFGGAKRVVYEQIKGLKKKGHSIDVYVLDHKEDIFDPYTIVDHVYTYRFDEESKTPFLKRIFNDLRVFFGLKNLHQKIAKDIDGRNYDLVLVHPDKLTQAPFILRFLKSKSAYYCQEPLRIAYEYSMRFTDDVSLMNKIYEEATRQIRKTIDRTNVRSATFTIASCYHVRERMIESYDVYPRVVYPGIDNKIFHAKKTTKTKDLIFVGGRNVFTDGYDLAEKALSYVPLAIRPKLRVIEWKKNSKERLTEEELVTIYNKSLAVFCLSRLETFGLVPLEAMACGVPVIATNLSGHRETVVNNETGFLVELDSKEIAEKVKFLVRNPRLAAQIGKKGVSHVAMHWTWDRANESLEKTLKMFVKNR